MDLGLLLLKLAECPIVPVLSVERVEDAAPLAEALAAGGICVAEMTLRTPAGLAAIAEMKRAAPDMVVGAGTVLSADDVRRALDGGADFLVSPGATRELLEAMAAARTVAMPGVGTPSEAMTAREMGMKHLKLFPANAVGGVDMLAGLYGPLPDLSFMPTGGVTQANMSGFLRLPNVIAVGGTWIARPQHIADRDWSGITARTIEAGKACKEGCET